MPAWKPPMGSKVKCCEPEGPMPTAMETYPWPAADCTGGAGVTVGPPYVDGAETKVVRGKLPDGTSQAPMLVALLCRQAASMRVRASRRARIFVSVPRSNHTRRSRAVGEVSFRGVL